MCGRVGVGQEAGLRLKGFVSGLSGKGFGRIVIKKIPGPNLGVDPFTFATPSGGLVSLGTTKAEVGKTVQKKIIV